MKAFIDFSTSIVSFLTLALITVSFFSCLISGNVSGGIAIVFAGLVFYAVAIGLLKYGYKVACEDSD